MFVFQSDVDGDGDDGGGGGGLCFCLCVCVKRVVHQCGVYVCVCVALLIFLQSVTNSRESLNFVAVMIFAGFTSKQESSLGSNESWAVEASQVLMVLRFEGLLGASLETRVTYLWYRR